MTGAGRMLRIVTGARRKWKTVDMRQEDVEKLCVVWKIKFI